MSKLEFPKAKRKQVLLNRRTKQQVILGLILGTIALGMSWLVWFKVEPVIYLTGQLNYQETVTKFQLPENSVIQKIYVKQGEQVQKGQQLLSFSFANSYKKLQNIENLQKELKEQNQFLKTVINKAIDAHQAEEAIPKLKISQQTAILIKNHLNLVKEKKSLQAQINQDKSQVALKIQQLKQLGKDRKPIITEIENQQQQIIENQKKIIIQQEKISNIEPQINKIFEKNQTQINEINHQIEKYKKRFKGIFLVSPLSGKIEQLDFLNNNVLQIIPKPELMADVFVSYQDRKLIHNNMKVEVIAKELDPKNSLPGKIVFIGSDLLPPNTIYPFYRLPLQVSLETNTTVQNAPKIPLKSDMAVTVKLPTTQKLTILEFIYKNTLMKIY